MEDVSLGKSSTSYFQSFDTYRDCEYSFCERDGRFGAKRKSRSNQ